MGIPTGPALDRLLEENVMITLADARKIASSKMEAQDHYDISEAGSCASVKEEPLHVLQESRGKSTRPTRAWKCQISAKENHSTNSSAAKTTNKEELKLITPQIDGLQKGNREGILDKDASISETY
ncbi:hypothetical protein Trydic_g19515 [Trypoxylus dichotomus]